MIKNFFSVIGLFVVVLAIFGSLDIGHFRLYYGNDEHGCSNMEAKLKGQPS